VNLFWTYLTDQSHWTGSGGITQRLSEHVVLSFAALFVAGLIAIPLGVTVGHSGRGDDLPILFTVLGRVLAPLGVLVYFAMKMGTGSGPAFFMLVLLAMPPMMAAGYAGVRLVDRAVVESARAAGMLPGQVLREVEIPIAMPALIVGARRAAAQVILCAAVAGYVGAGGLGRLIFDGQSPAVHNYGEVATGGVVLAVLAMAVDVLINWFGAGLVTPGASGKLPTDKPKGRPVPRQRAESAGRADALVGTPGPVPDPAER
jgi:osmoprotectant transport system permease protein